MDEKFVAELIEDMEHMGRLLERCVRRLRSQVSADALPAASASMVEAPRVSGMRDDIRAEIDRQRKAIMAQVDEIKAQAMQAATAAKGGVSGAPMTGLGAMGGVGGGLSSEMMEELRRKLAEKTEKAEKPEKDPT
jgi:ElaB/YqjD/DUF883 family membrane-anchored ribosome-binding protein